MPSARLASFKGGGGILRDQDATVLDIRFTPDNPLAGKSTAKPDPNKKKSDFKSLFAVLTMRVDGAETNIEQPVWVGDATQFDISEDGRSLIGDAPLSKSSGWYTLLDSLVTAGFDDSVFPEDPVVADYSALRGVRARFSWQKNAKATEKYGKKVSAKDPKKSYDREDLIVTNYYETVEVDESLLTASTTPVAAKTAARPGASKSAAAKSKTAPKAAAVDAVKFAQEQILLAVNAAKDQTISKSKLSIKLLTQLQTENPDLRGAVRTWADDSANLAKVPGVVFDADSEMLTLDAE